MWNSSDRSNEAVPVSGREALAASATVAHWLAALDAGADLGHFGRLAFATVARHFLPDEELLALLAAQPGYDVAKARRLLEQVQARGYLPPSRPRLLAWQARQRFPLLPSDDPSVGNLYRELPLPDDVFGRIEQFWEGES
ncbi:MAG: hypothetical protein U0836_01470 [Pirellulales bacterium]